MMMMMRKEAALRFSALVFLLMTSLLVGFDRQTKLLFFTVTKKATFRDMDALVHLEGIASAFAGYNLVQLFRCFFSSASPEKLISSHQFLAWALMLLDQVVAYIMFAANTAALQACIFALNGESSLQWMKVCDRFTRFCNQIGGALLCGYAAIVFMALISSLSAFTLFRLYSPRLLLVLKGKP